MSNIIEEFKKELEQRAKAGDPDTMCEIALHCKLGSFGFKKSDRDAFKWYERAAAMDHARGTFMLGKCYHIGSGVKEDRDKAVELYLKAEKLGLSDKFLGELYHSIGNIYYDACMYGVSKFSGGKDYAKVIEYYEKVFDYDYFGMIAHQRLAEFYEEGLGTERNIIKAIKHNTLGARAVNTGGAANDAGYIARLLGEIDADAEAAKSDENKKILGDAAYYIASWYFDGSREIPRHDEGVKWLKLAVKFDSIPAHYLLGTAYENGDGIDQDIRRAVELYEKAAAAENADAQLALARCYLNGDEPDDAECKTNDLEGSSRKNNIIKNPELAKEWLDRAAANGSSEAKKMLEEM